MNLVKHVQLAICSHRFAIGTNEKNKAKEPAGERNSKELRAKKNNDETHTETIDNCELRGERERERERDGL